MPAIVENLARGFTFADLYDEEEAGGLCRLDATFLADLQLVNPPLYQSLLEARNKPESLTLKNESNLLIELGPYLEDFLAEIFGVQKEVQALQSAHHRLSPLYAVKRQFIQRKVARSYAAEAVADFDGFKIARELSGFFDESHLPCTNTDVDTFELVFAQQVLVWEKESDVYADALELATRYAAWGLYHPLGRQHHEAGVLFHIPRKTDPLHLLDHSVEKEILESPQYPRYRIRPEHLRPRTGFSLTDQGTSLRGALDETNYCIWCHEQGKDSCSHGLREKAVAGETTPPGFKRSPLGIPLAGCPLEEKISEFHLLKSRGYGLGALGIIMVDNPLVAGTGHRICNDCMKACIYQKQEPVDIPQAETRTLRDVLGLPFGFEIYSLLSRWNPLNVRRPLPKLPTGYTVLVVGLGPAGCGLSHHLQNDGHTIVAIDGLKIEPLPGDISGVLPNGERTPFRPIRDIAEIQENLDERIAAGFGGVAEYGITVRWDKNFLKIIRLLLERRSRCTIVGGVRFGSTITLQQAWEWGFDHVALCMGAGKPSLPEVPNALTRGVRTASDFLMALQLTGAAKKDSLANLQISLPIVVIGGGLTAIDTATESLAYYPVQVEKFLTRAEAIGEAAFLQSLSPEEHRQAEQWLTHARALRQERTAAKNEGRPSQIISLLRSWGGATIAYRRRLIDSPAYTLNHEEVELALEEGIYFSECLSPIGFEQDENSALIAAQFIEQKAIPQEDGTIRWEKGGMVRLPARSVFIATGTSPNTVLAREDSEHFVLDKKYFAAINEEGEAVSPERAISKPSAVEVLVHRHHDGRFVSFWGDLHPSYSGNVVKALGSVKQGYPVVSRVLSKRPSSLGDQGFSLPIRVNQEWRAYVVAVERLTPNIVDVIVKAPMAARNFRPGQFYRLQNYETLSALIPSNTAGENGVEGKPLVTRMAMEGLALTGASSDPVKGLLSLIVLEMGGASDLCRILSRGEPVVLMGPTGAPTHIPSNESVILVGGGLGNAVLFSIGVALRTAGSRVLYFAGYKKQIDRYKVAEIESAADVIVWCCDEAPGFTPTRPQDRTFVGNIVAAMQAYAEGRLGEPTWSINQAGRIIAIGSDQMMAAVAVARHQKLRPWLKDTHIAIGSINSPMQCMMKEICAQCLQQHRLPDGTLRYVFSCFEQDQDLDTVDFKSLNQRLKQNAVQEKLSARWLQHCLLSYSGTSI